MELCFTWYKILEQKRGQLQFSGQTRKYKTRWYLISQLVFFFLYCFPHHGSAGLLSEIDKNWTPFVTAWDAWSHSKIFCLDAIIPTPLFFEWHLTQCICDLPCSGMEMTIAWWREKLLFSGFCFYLLWLWIFPALPWRLKCAQHFCAIRKHIFSMPVFMKKVKEA